MFFYSVDKDEETGKMSYAKYTAQAEDAESIEPPDIAIPPDNDNDGFPDDAPEALKEVMQILNEEDEDGDGIPNAWDAVSGSLNKAQDEIINTLEFLSCTGGMGGIPMPINFALFAPGPINVMGIAVGTDPGLPIFGWGAPSTIPIWPPTPYQSTMGGRIYISPTLTGKIGASVCVGPYMGASCWTVILPDIPLPPSNPLSSAGVANQQSYCDTMSEAITNSMLKAEDYITSRTSSMMLLNGQGLTPKNINAESNIKQIVRSETGGVAGSPGLGSYGINASASTNVQVPGFVNVIASWFARQTEEIFTKLSDLPDLYILYPNPKSFVNPMPPDPKLKNLTDVLTYVNKLPLVELESKSILIKIPAITQKEIIKMQTELRLWVTAAKAEVDRVKKIWTCDRSTGQQTICDKLLVDADGLIQKVEKNIKILEEYKKLPRKILAWRNIHIKYIYQIICYLDTIVQYVGGYIKKQELRIKAWIDLIAKIRRELLSWQAGIDLMIDYMKGCDTCKTERYGLLQLLLQIFIQIPDPPIIPFPKWPDFYFDFSNVKVGIKLIWPDVRFKAEPIIFPTLPRFSLPDVPSLTISLDDIDIPTLPELPELPELPDLPPLPLPTLPDIPKPPEIPKLLPSLQVTLGLFSKIIKILCLLKKGFLPVMESSLKTHIETLTARPLDLTLPIDLMFTFQAPTVSIPFVEKIKVTTKIDLSVETEFIYTITNEIAQVWNSIATDIVESTNEGLQQLGELSQAIAAPDIEIENVDLNLSTYVPSVFLEEIDETIRLIEEESEKQKELLASIPDSYHLIAEESYIDPNHPSLNKPLEEIKNQISNEDLPDQVEGNHLTALRNAMLAYAEEEKQVTNIFKQSSNYDQVTYIANNYPTLDKYIREGMLASTEPLSIQPENNTQINDTNEVNSTIQEFRDVFENRLLAINSDVISSAVIDPETATNPPLGQYIKGLYVYEPEQGLNERILLYEGELDFDHHGAFFDIDEDGDEDIVYSYGGNVYLKENYSKPKSSKYSKYSAKNPDVYNLSEFIPFIPSVNGYNTNYDSGTQTDFNWTPEYSSHLFGYEIVYKNSRQDFDNPYGTPSHKINIFEKPTSIMTIGRIKDDIEITTVNGAFTVNGDVTSLYGFGDTIATSSESNTEIALTFSDSSQIILGPDTEITLPDYIPGNFELVIHKGKPLLKSNFFINLFLQEGSTVITEDDAEALLEYKNGDTVSLDPNTVFFGSFVESGYAHVDTIDGDAVMTALPRTVITKSSPIFEIEKGHFLHTMEDSTLVITPEEGSKQIMNLSKNIIVPISQNYASNLKIDLSAGKIEIINPNSQRVPDIPVERGMFVQFDDTIYMHSGQATIQLANGPKTYLSTGDSLLLKELTDPENPFFTLDTDIANYYSQIYTFDGSGNRSNPSEIELFAPQLCSDKEVPFAEAGPSERTVIIYQELQIDASKSFDTSGDITAYYLDTNPEKDSDEDNDPANDRDMINDDWTNPVFTLGPYIEIGSKTVVLNVEDESGNIGKQVINIEIIVPDITLDKPSDHEAEVTGSIDPVAELIPIHLIRNRSGMVTQLISDEADENGRYFTDEDGEFRITGLEYEDTLLLRNADGDIVAEIDDITGRVVIVDDRYYVDVLEATPPNLPTRVVVKEKANEMILLTLLMIPDLNTDVTIDTQDVVYTIETVEDFEGVHIKDLNENDDYKINPLPASDPNFTGGVEIRNLSDDLRISIVDSGGNIYFFNENLDLRLKAALVPEEPIIIEMLYGGDVITEMYIAVNNERLAEITNREALGMPPEDITMSDQDEDGMSDSFEFMHGFDAQNPDDAGLDNDGDGLSNLEEFRLNTNPLNSDTDGDGFTDGEEVAFGKDPTTKAATPFTDVPADHPYYDSIVNLSQKNILRGLYEDGNLYFNPDAYIDRKDFTDIILKMLCIVPRPEAYREPPLFFDMPYTEATSKGEDYYYPVVKEAVLQGFITGYVGEKDPETGLSPFKPNISITRAETVKIVLEALEMQKIVTLRDIKEEEIWYRPYMEISTDLTPILLKETEVKQTYILTEEEASDPNSLVTRAEFAAIADRVLQAFDCYQIDDDGDGMPSVWELQNGLDPFDSNDGNEDPDGEGLINLDEYRFGTDPFNPDTDYGGTNDKVEVDRGTNPVNFPEDDPLDPSAYQITDEKDPRGGLEEGIYIVEEECNSCPCPSAIDHKADLIPDDIFFAIISDEDLSTIFAKSNELIFKGLDNQ
jgi:hypothetical protein